MVIDAIESNAEYGDALYQDQKVHESNVEDGDALYQDQKVHYYLREKKNTYRITSWNCYRLLYPVLKSDMVTCTPVKQKLK